MLTCPLSRKQLKRNQSKLLVTPLVWSSSLTSSIASTVVSNKPIVAKTTEGYQSIYRSTSETIMPFIPVICMYFGDGICPKAYGIYSEDVIIDRII